MDQKQARSAAVPRARPSESAQRDAVGLPHLQPATVDSSGYSACGSCRRLKRESEQAEHRLDSTSGKAEPTQEFRNPFSKAREPRFFHSFILKRVGVLASL